MLLAPTQTRDHLYIMDFSGGCVTFFPQNHSNYWAPRGALQEEEEEKEGFVWKPNEAQGDLVNLGNSKLDPPIRSLPSDGEKNPQNSAFDSRWSYPSPKFCFNGWRTLELDEVFVYERLFFGFLRSHQQCQFFWQDVFGGPMKTNMKS